MKKNVNLDLATIKEITVRHKQAILSGVMIFVSLILLVKFVVPLGKLALENNAARKTELKKLAIIKDNLALVSSLNKDTLEAQTLVLTKALPLEKDFAGVLQAISDAGLKSSVSIESFDFRVGDITKIQQKGSPNTFMEIIVNIQGDSYSVINFVNQLSESLPISEVSSFDLNQSSTVVRVMFYYKPFNKANLTDEVVLKKPGPKEEELIEKLKAWDTDLPALIPEFTEDVSTATSSGQPF